MVILETKWLEGVFHGSKKLVGVGDNMVGSGAGWFLRWRRKDF